MIWRTRPADRKSFAENAQSMVDFKPPLPYNISRRLLVRKCRTGGEGSKLEIRVGENESLESALKRFKRKCARSGVLAEVRRREHYEKPSVKRKKKAEAARKRKY